MKKSAIKKSRSQDATRTRERTLGLARFVRQTLYEFVIEEGVKAFDLLLQAEQNQLCGPAYQKGKPGDPLRWGNTDGRLVMGGRRVVVRKPRVRQNGKEIALPSWQEFAAEDPLNQRTLEQALVGVSTRNYDRSIEDVPDEYGPHGAAKSSVSRRFVALTAEQLEAWRIRDLSELHIAAVMIDGIQVGEHTVVVALGFDETGQKHPLGLWQGATENATVCTQLLSNLTERGLDPRLVYLFVIDGSKALRKAIRNVFGKRALVQRCQQHKRRNVLGHLPKRMHGSVSRMLREAYRSKSRSVAKKRLLQLVSHLEDDHPDAASSLSEGLDETLTLKDLALPASLERTLSTTNAIENLNGGIRRVTRNVKRWRDGKMVRRWVAAAIVELERGFHRLRGYRGLPQLLAALGRQTERTTRVDRRREAA